MIASSEVRVPVTAGGIVWTLSLMGLSLMSCSAENAETAARSTAQTLTAECIEAAEEVEAEAWVCPEPFTMECQAARVEDQEVIYFTPPDEESCEGLEPSVQSGPFPPGVHTITVRGEDGEIFCRSELTVVDTVPPTIDVTPVEIWPPNHEMVTISPEDCGVFVDACDPEVKVHFTSVSSSEMVDGQGDGNTAPDVEILDCTHVRVRAERSGTGEGRLYRLGLASVDAAGFVTTGTCDVIVPHDQGSGELRVPSSEFAYTKPMHECEPPDGSPE